MIHCTPTRLRLETIGGEAPATAVEEEYAGEGAQSYILQMREFGDCVRSGRAPETGGEAGLHALAVIEAMGRAAASGCAVDVPTLLDSGASS